MKSKPVLVFVLVLTALLALATTSSRAHDEPSLAGERTISLPDSTEPALRLGVTTADGSARVNEAIPSPQGLCTDKYEPNDSFLKAWPISSGMIWSYICAATDNDYYSFPVGAGNTISVTLDKLPADYNLCLYSPSMTEIECSENSGKQAESIQRATGTPGTHYIWVYGVQGAYSTEKPYRLTLEVNAPDLTITDIWEDSDEICYQVWNSGGAHAVQGTVVSLTVDLQDEASDTLPGIAAGQRLKRCFPGYTWQCSLSSDSIKVLADALHSVDESDETNNSRSETWQCDTTPPEITSGPLAAQVSQTGAVIQWMTDEDADSTVRYDLHAGTYALSQTNPTLTQNHIVTLKGLTPSTVYHYVVESTDASGNTVTSAEGFFETASPADSEPPSVASLTVTRIPGDRELYWVSIPASDTVGVDRVEFYINGVLIGTDYTPDDGGSGAAGVSPAVASSGYYGVKLDPPAMGLSRNTFFSVQQSFMAEAFDREGLSVKETMMYAPTFEPVDINLSVWPAYDRTQYVDTPADTVPAGTTINVSVHAAEEEWGCTWVILGEGPPGSGGGPIHCRDVETAVESVEFKVDGVPVHTWTPAGGDLDHTYPWDVGGLGVGTYTLRVTAYAHDGASLSVARRLYVEVGEPDLDIARSVTREGNYFRVQLTLENFGTASAGIDNIRDNVTGFQPVMTSTSSYDLVPEYWAETRHNDVEIEVSSGGDDILWLAPGESLVVEYLAVPILYEDSDTFGYGIGARDEVKVWDQGGFCRWQLDRPAPSTAGGELLAEAVNAARAAADYIIVTHPRNLYVFDASRSDVYTLLATMAELAQIKTGILGYVDVWNADDIRSQVIAWGSGMKGSDGVDDHYLSNGYLLLVGEAEILGSWTSDHGWRGTVHYTDLPFANTSGEWVDPELIVSRIIGNCASEMTVPLRASIRVHWGEPDYHFTKECALLTSGRGDGYLEFEENVDDVHGLLIEVSSDFSSGCVDTIKRRVVEDVDGLDVTNVFTSSVAQVPGRDVLFYRDHCSAEAWSGVITTTVFPIDFAEKKPFAFACCCQAGRYEGLGVIGIAEAFMLNEAPVYIGATENSERDTNDIACRWFFDRWADRSESIGQSFRQLKRDLGGRDGDYWAAEYNLYGDPKYGSMLGVTALAQEVAVASTTPVTSLVVTVPDYVLTTTVQGEHHVHIPESNMLVEEGMPLVPVYQTEVEYAPGYRVQDVALVSRSGMITETGLNISVATVATDTTAARPMLSTGSGEWWPDLERDFEWSIWENADGSTTLVILVYPFYYNSLTTEATFFKDYDFDIEVISSTVEIVSLATDEYAYAQGDEIPIALAVANSGAAQDVIVSMVVKTDIEGETVDGLLLESLASLTGTASLSAQWDSTGVAAGYYRVEAEARDGAGNVLDRASRQFRLGLCGGEITAFEAAPGLFQVGDTVGISMTFHNTGTVPITGTAVIQVQDASSTVVAEYRNDVVGLAPGGSISFNESWDSSGSPDGDYRVVGYVLYDSKATTLHTASITTIARIYLPLVLRQ